MKQAIVLAELAAIAAVEINEPYCNDKCVENRAKWHAHRQHCIEWKDMARDFRAFCKEYAKTHN